MVHPSLLEIDRVYSTLRNEIERLEDDKESLSQQVLEKREELDKLRTLAEQETSAMDGERKALESEKAEFEGFRTEALSQMESFREQLEEEKREFDEAKVETKSAIELDRQTLSEKASAIEQDQKVKEAKLELAATQLDEERAEFETYKSSARADISRSLEALEEEKVRVGDESGKFETYRNEALAQLKAEQERFETEREEFSKSRSALQAALLSGKEEADAEYSAFKKEKEMSESELAEEKRRITNLQAELEKLEGDLQQQKWRLIKERKHYEEERKHLSRLLLGMGEKMSNNGYSAMEDDLLDANPLDQSQKEVAVYNGTASDENLMGVIPIYPSTTVGDIRTFIADKFLHTPAFSMKKRGNTIRITQDEYSATDYFKTGDYINATVGQDSPLNGSPSVGSASLR